MKKNVLFFFIILFFLPSITFGSSWRVAQKGSQSYVKTFKKGVCLVVFYSKNHLFAGAISGDSVSKMQFIEIWKEKGKFCKKHSFVKDKGFSDKNIPDRMFEKYCGSPKGLPNNLKKNQIIKILFQ